MSPGPAAGSAGEDVGTTARPAAAGGTGRGLGTGTPAAVARIESAGEGRLVVTGPLDFSTVTRLFKASERLFAPGRPLTVDLGAVSAANSAGLALLLEWMDLARARGIALDFLRLPDSLARIAAVSNLRDLLPVAAPEAARAPDSSAGRQAP